MIIFDHICFHLPDFWLGVMHCTVLHICPLQFISNYKFDVSDTSSSFSASETTITALGLAARSHNGTSTRIGKRIVPYAFYGPCNLQPPTLIIQRKLSVNTTQVLQCLLQLVLVDGVVLVFVKTMEYALPGLCPHCKTAYATARRQQTPHML